MGGGGEEGKTMAAILLTHLQERGVESGNNKERERARGESESEGERERTRTIGLFRTKLMLSLLTSGLLHVNM